MRSSLTTYNKKLSDHNIGDVNTVVFRQRYLAGGGGATLNHH